MLIAAEDALAGVAIKNFPEGMGPEERKTHALCRFCRFLDTAFGEVEMIGPDGKMTIVVLLPWPSLPCPVRAL